MHTCFVLEQVPDPINVVNQIVAAAEKEGASSLPMIITMSLGSIRNPRLFPNWKRLHAVATTKRRTRVSGLSQFLKVSICQASPLTNRQWDDMDIFLLTFEMSVCTFGTV